MVTSGDRKATGDSHTERGALLKAGRKYAPVKRTCGIVRVNKA